MTRRRYVQIEGELIEVAPDYETPGKDSARINALLWNDREYQDMGDSRFASRSQHREYMKRHNLTTTDDFTDTWRNREKSRVEAKHGIDRSRKGDIEQAVHKLNQGYKPHIERDE